MLLPINFPRLQGYLVAPISPGDRQAVQQLIERCRDDLALITGRKPGTNEVDRLYHTLPTGKTHDDKMLLGIFSGSPERLVGLLDAIQNYPQPNEWYLGVLLLDPAERGNGLGTKIYQLFEQWLTDSGASSIWLSVFDLHQPAYHFWQKLGFEEIERTKEKAGHKIVMRRPLASATSG